jgi:hypothetical protein
MKLDSMKFDSMKLDSMKFYSIKFDNLKLDNMKLDNMKFKSTKFEKQIFRNGRCRSICTERCNVIIITKKTLMRISGTAGLCIFRVAQGSNFNLRGQWHPYEPTS